MFPGGGAQIYRNEAGEPIGWDYPADDATTYWCDLCGVSHPGVCPDDQGAEFDDDEGGE